MPIRFRIGSVRSGYPVEGAAALGFRAGILCSSSGVKRCGYRLIIMLGNRSVPLCNIWGLMSLHDQVHAFSTARTFWPIRDVVDEYIPD